MNSFLWAISAASIWGIVPILEKAGLSKIAPFTALFYRCVGVMLAPILLSIFVVKPAELKAVDPKAIALLVLSGFLASFVGQIFFYHGLKTGEVSRIVCIAGSFPLITFALGVIIFGEAVTAAKLIGVGLIVSGIWMLK